MTDQNPQAVTSLPEEELKKRFAVSQRLSMAFGEIVSILMRSQTHKHLSLADLEWAVAPAVVTGQFSLAEAQSKANGMVAPVAVVMWAFVSDEVDQRLSAAPDKPVRLSLAEWRSGNHLWVMEAIGEPRVVGSMLERLVQNEWKGHSAKIRSRNAEGQPVVATLQPKPAPAA